jgi:FMN phosphatase YigB (HAD superfamily)
VKRAVNAPLEQREKRLRRVGVDAVYGILALVVPDEGVATAKFLPDVGTRPKLVGDDGGASANRLPDCAFQGLCSHVWHRRGTDVAFALHQRAITGALLVPRSRLWGPVPGRVRGHAQSSRFLRQNKIIHGIATSNLPPHINPSLKALGVTKETVVVERGDVAGAKPEPDLFLECQERLGVEVKDCYVIGDAVWDLMAVRRAGMLSVGLLTVRLLGGGYGEDELVLAGAFRVFRDAADLHNYPDELGVLP